MSGERVILVVPMIGAGTFEDPQRPLFTPIPGTSSHFDGFSWMPSDDGRLAIVMLVVKESSSLASLRQDRRVARAFRRGTDRREDVERELKKLKKDLVLERLLGGAR